MKVDFESYLIHYLQNNEFKIKQVADVPKSEQIQDTVSISKEAKELYERHFKLQEIKK